MKAMVKDSFIILIALSRKSVKHFLDKDSKKDFMGKNVSQHDQKAADDALKHIFLGQTAYSPYFCGDDIDWGLQPVPDNEWVCQLNRMFFQDAIAKVS